MSYFTHSVVDSFFIHSVVDICVMDIVSKIPNMPLPEKLCCDSFGLNIEVIEANLSNLPIFSWLSLSKKQDRNKNVDNKNNFELS